MAKKGDWVSAQVSGTSNVIEGAFVKDLNGDIVVENRAGQLTCTKEGVQKLPDPPSPDLKAIQDRVRRS